MVLIVFLQFLMVSDGFKCFPLVFNSFNGLVMVWQWFGLVWFEFVHLLVFNFLVRDDVADFHRKSMFC